MVRNQQIQLTVDVPLPPLLLEVKINPARTQVYTHQNYMAYRINSVSIVI